MRTGATDTGAGFGIGFYATENEATMVRDGLLAVETITLSDGSSHSLEPILLTKEFLQSKAAFIRNLPSEMSCAELKEMLETFTLEHEVHDIFIKLELMYIGMAYLGIVENTVRMCAGGWLL